MITSAAIRCSGTLELYLFSITDCLSPCEEHHGDRQAAHAPGVLQHTEGHGNQHKQESGHCCNIFAVSALLQQFHADNDSSVFSAS